jgi:hypothetical protein
VGGTSGEGGDPASSSRLTSCSHGRSSSSAPTSRSARPASFRPEILVNDQATRVLVETVGAVNATRLGELADHVTGDELWGIDEALLTVLGLQQLERTSWHGAPRAHNPKVAGKSRPPALCVWPVEFHRSLARGFTADQGQGSGALPGGYVAGVTLSRGPAVKELEAAEKSALIAQVDFFTGCTQREVDDIAKRLVDRHFAIGDELCRQGDAETHGFVLVDGQAAVLVDGEQVATATGGDVVGELSMLGTGRRTATLRALTSVHALLIEPDEIDSVLSADPSSGQRLGRRTHDD